MPANYDGSNDDLAKRKNNAAEKIIIIEETQTESSTSDANTNLPDQTKKPEQSTNNNPRQKKDGQNVLCNWNKIHGAMIASDQEKAFDKGNWDFLFKTLHHFGYGPKIIQKIKAV